jgi:hypothetical protein
MTAEIHLLGIFLSTLGAKHISSSDRMTTAISVYGTQGKKVPSAGMA